MRRPVGNRAVIEMAALGLFELLLSFLGIYVTVGAAVGPDAALHVPAGGLPGFDNASVARAAVLATIIVGCGLLIGLYRPTIYLDRRRLILHAALAAVIAFTAALVVGSHISGGLSRSYVISLVEVLVGWLGFVVLSRTALRLVLRHGVLARRVLLIGSAGQLGRAAEVLHESGSRPFELAGQVDAEVGRAVGAISPERLRRERIWAVVALLGGGADRSASAIALRQRLRDCKLRGIRIFDEVSFWERHLGRINLDRIDDTWFLRADGFVSSATGAATKRAIDVAASLLLLLITLPLMLATALAIKLDSTGPVLYRQRRVGLHGVEFTLLKFRSMRTDAEAGGRPRWAAKGDPRVTRVGAFIRSTRIDELPQLFNVLGGAMSLVGPRPERMHFVEQLAELIPFYNERSYVKPGITGWAQVNYPYGASVEDAREKLSYDLYYVKNRSVFLDLWILLLTVRVILFREGAR